MQNNDTEEKSVESGQREGETQNLGSGRRGDLAMAPRHRELSFANDLPYGVSCDTFPVKFL